jgi:hypothetical protein|tara:strand:+ start:293 stop:808 length:516 start_codon:yes stop_codon:yes gene_type:complete
MALVINDRVKEISTTTGTGTLTLGGAQTGFETFSAGIGASNTTYYAIYNQDTNEWEVGLGTLNAGATTLARTTVITSSNSDNLVDFTSGTKDVFCTLPASKAVYLDADGKAVGVEGGNIETLGDTFSNYNDINTNTTTTLVATKNAFLAGIITISASAVWTIGGTGTLTII